MVWVNPVCESRCYRVIIAGFPLRGLYIVSTAASPISVCKTTASQASHRRQETL